MSDVDWNVELRKIERQFDGLPPNVRGRRSACRGLGNRRERAIQTCASPSSGSGHACSSSRSWRCHSLVALRASVRLSARLVLLANAVVIVGGVALAVRTWRDRIGWVFGGSAPCVVVAWTVMALHILPRLGYSPTGGTSAGWSCAAISQRWDLASVIPHGRGWNGTRRGREQAVRERSESEPHADIEQHLRRRRLEHDGRAGGPHDHFLDRSEAAATAVVPPAIVDDLSRLDRLDADDLEAMQDQHVATDHDRLRGRHLLLGLPGREPARRAYALFPARALERPWRSARGTRRPLTGASGTGLRMRVHACENPRNRVGKRFIPGTPRAARPQPAGAPGHNAQIDVARVSSQVHPRPVGRSLPHPRLVLSERPGRPTQCAPCFASGLGKHHRDEIPRPQRFNSDSAPIRQDQQADACDRQEPAVDGPLRLTSHEAPRKDVDSLKNPDASHEQTQDASRRSTRCASVTRR